MSSIHQKKKQDTSKRKARGNYRDPVQGFFNLVDMDAVECWEWLGWLDKDGYGAYTPYRIKKRAHRVSYEMFVGDIPDGFVIDHLCRNTSCVNPTHLEAVTNKENIHRGIAPSAINRLKTHCKYGHPLSGSNLMFRANGTKRNCRICDRRNGREYELRKKAANRHLGETTGVTVVFPSQDTKGV